MIGIKVSVDTHEFERQIGSFNRNQIPYATAVALTRTAQDTQKQIREELPKQFTLRNTWTVGGIRYRPASKLDWPDCKSVVGTIDQRMVEHETGETRSKPLKGKHFVYPTKNIRPDIKKLIPRSKQPGAILKGVQFPYRNKRGPTGSKKKPLPFLAIMPGGKTGIFIRTAKRVSSGGKRERLGRQMIKMLYELRAKPVHFKQREWLRKTAQRIAEKKFPNHFERELLAALASAR